MTSKASPAPAGLSLLKEAALISRTAFDTGAEIIVTEQWDTKHPACPPEFLSALASQLCPGQKQYSMTRAAWVAAPLPFK
jgi:hypothetical protein